MNPVVQGFFEAANDALESMKVKKKIWTNGLKLILNFSALIYELYPEVQNKPMNKVVAEGAHQKDTPTPLQKGLEIIKDTIKFLNEKEISEIAEEQSEEEIKRLINLLEEQNQLLLKI